MVIARVNLNTFLIFILQVKLILSAEICEEQHTCDECIRVSADCVWCAEDNFKGTRCRNNETKLDNWCKRNLIDPRSTINSTVNRNFSEGLETVVQLKPQKYKIELRPGETVKFNFAYKRAVDYPVDLYFLFDASTTMKDIVHDTVRQGQQIYDIMSGLTKNVYVGLGSFVDKNALPYANEINSELTYSFKNQLKLTNESDIFITMLRNMTFGSNYDIPEGGLDALAQVLTCKKEIGWRNDSFKIVIFFTDSIYHSAGDGIYAGIYQPYDGKCYTEDNVYTKELEMDYPSVGILNKLSADEEIKIIFLINQTFIGNGPYELLSKSIGGSKAVAYNNKPDMITNELQQFYKDISDNIVLKYTTSGKYERKIKVSFNPDCTKKKSCIAKKGQQTEFEGSITLLEYSGESEISVKIFVEGIREKITLDIKVIDECNCKTKNSSVCNNGGTNNCGICECNKNRYGDNCECNIVNDQNIHLNCVAEGGTIPCNGNGVCGNCGACICSYGYDGDLCECKTKKCPRGNNGALCGGHGDCNCDGTCNCSANWSGNSCDCSLLTEPCILNGKTCNNRGICKCGTCKCESLEWWDARTLSETTCVIKPCPDCQEHQCELLKTCAVCHNTHQDNSKCGGICSDTINVTRTSEAEKENASWNICDGVRVDVGCFIRYWYKYNDDAKMIEVVVQNERDCQQTYYMVGGICLGTILIAGIGTLIAWKLLTDARDRREYKLFLKEQDSSTGVCMNPIHIPPSTTFLNPAFGK